MIPKRIIQTHRSRSSTPPSDLSCMEQLKSLHPEWEFQFYADGDCIRFVEGHYPQYLELYHWFPRPVMRADLFRLLVVHAFGGFYLDTDMWLTKPLDDLLDHEAVFPWESELAPDQFDHRFPSLYREQEKPMQIGNYAFGAIAGHPFLHNGVIEMIRRTEFLEVENLWDLDILYATGPDMISTVKYRGGAGTDTLTLLEGNPYCFGKHGIHLMSGSWRA